MTFDYKYGADQHTENNQRQNFRADGQKINISGYTHAINVDGGLK